MRSRVLANTGRGAASCWQRRVDVQRLDWELDLQAEGLRSHWYCMQGDCTVVVFAGIRLRAFWRALASHLQEDGPPIRCMCQRCVRSQAPVYKLARETTERHGAIGAPFEQLRGGPRG